MKSPPKVFISYSWDNSAHIEWVKDFATRLRKDGLDVLLDQWGAIPGDQLPLFMEKAVRESDFVIIICTKKYKEKSDNRYGGVGYEGDVITAEVFTTQNHRKFIPVLRSGFWAQASPSWLKGKYYIQLQENPYSEQNYFKLLQSLHGVFPTPPPIGVSPFHIGMQDIVSQKNIQNDDTLRQEFEVLLWELKDRIINKKDTLLTLKRIVNPLTINFNKQQFYHWQDFKGNIDLVRVQVYEFHSGRLIDNSINIVSHDLNKLHLECVLLEHIGAYVPLTFVFEVKAENYFPNLFNVDGSGIGYSDFPIRFSVKKFIYQLIIPNNAKFSGFNVFAYHKKQRILKPNIIGGEVVYSFKRNNLEPTDNIKITIENTKITSIS